jgi:ubiquitin carboxyl-terminal hydrolase 10
MSRAKSLVETFCRRRHRVLQPEPEMFESRPVKASPPRPTYSKPKSKAPQKVIETVTQAPITPRPPKQKPEPAKDPGLSSPSVPQYESAAPIAAEAVKSAEEKQEEKEAAAAAAAEPEPMKVEITETMINPSEERDHMEQEIVELLIRAQRIQKSTGAPIELCLEQIKQAVSDKTQSEKPRMKRVEFESTPEGLLIGAKIIEQ